MARVGCWSLWTRGIMGPLFERRWLSGHIDDGRANLFFAAMGGRLLGQNSPMRIGIHLTPFFSPTDLLFLPTQVVDEVVAIAQRASQLGYAWISAPHHWTAHPSVWPQPFPLLARLAPETGSMRPMTPAVLYRCSTR